MTANQQRAGEGRFLTGEPTLNRDKNLLHMIPGRAPEQIEDKLYIQPYGHLKNAYHQKQLLVLEI